MDIDTVLLVEELAANAWRPEIEQNIDGWRLRATGGASRRVNSVWPNLEGGRLTVEERLRMAEDFYHRRGLPPRFQMCPAAIPDDLADILEKRGYIDSAHTMVQTAPMSTVLTNTKAPSVKLTCSSELEETWFQAYTEGSGYAAESLPIRHGILSRIGPAACFALLSVDGRPVATSLGVMERGWLGVFCMVTNQEDRRQGFATQALHALADWGRVQGAENIYLQVMKNNPPALAMYRKLGFEDGYQYYYLTQE